MKLIFKAIWPFNACQITCYSWEADALKVLKCRYENLTKSLSSCKNNMPKFLHSNIVYILSHMHLHIWNVCLQKNRTIECFKNWAAAVLWGCSFWGWFYGFVYVGAPALECDFNKAALRLCWGCTSASMFSCGFGGTFRSAF